MAKPITPEQLARNDSEDGHQMALFAQAALHRELYPQLKWMHAIPNGGSRHIVEAGKLVAAGVRKGVSDIFLPSIQYRNRDDMIVDNYVNFAGLYIEMKAPGRKNAKYGGLSQDQIDFMSYAVIAGYKCVVCYTWVEAWNEIVKYLNGE